MSLAVGESSEVFIALLENFSLFFVQLKYGFFYGTVFSGGTIGKGSSMSGLWLMSLVNCCFKACRTRSPLSLDSAVLTCVWPPSENLAVALPPPP